MRHFASRSEYLDAADARLDDFDADEPVEEIARTTVVTYRGDVARGVLETVEPSLEWGWCPMSILEHSAHTPERTVPDHATERLDGYVPVSSAAYYVLCADLEALRAQREAGREEASE